MAKPDPFAPSKSDRFTFGLWTVGQTGRDPFGMDTRPALEPAKIVELLGEVEGVYGVNFHDNDLVPIDASDAEAARLKKDFRAALKRTGLRVAMATTNLFSHPVFKDGAFTSNDAEVRAYAIQKVMRGMALGAEFGAKVYVFWGGREGVESDASKDPVLAIQRCRQALNFLCKYKLDRGFGYRFALEAKPNEPRGHLYMSTTGSYLGFIQTLDHPEMVGLNPELAHEHMAGLNFTHHVAQALEAGKLFHIDLNDQEYNRFDQDFRFGSVSYKQSFFLVKLLTDHRYKGHKHFDAHAYRTADYDDVKEFARGCMRSYKVLEHKVQQFNADPQVKKLLRQINRPNRELEQLVAGYSKANADRLLRDTFDRDRLARRHLPYEKLDQLVFDHLMGVR